MSNPETSEGVHDVSSDTAVRLGAAAWRISSFCESSACVEAAPIKGGMAVRGTQDPGNVLVFPAGAWGAFVEALNAGELKQ